MKIDNLTLFQPISLDGTAQRSLISKDYDMEFISDLLVHIKSKRTGKIKVVSLLNVCDFIPLETEVIEPKPIVLRKKKN